MQFLNSHEFPMTTPSPDDDVFAHVTAAADVAVLSDPGRAFQHRALFDNRAAADENGVADERLPDQLAEHRRLEPKLQITRDLFERVPDVFVVLEKLRMRGVLELEKFGGAKHVVRNLTSGAPA